jgi:hypothetical protein
MGKVLGRAEANSGADFVTETGLLDVKNAKKFVDAANTTNKKDFLKLVGTMKANKDVKYVIDFANSGVTKEQLGAAINKLTSWSREITNNYF